VHQASVRAAQARRGLELADTDRDVGPAWLRNLVARVVIGIAAQAA
jgi:hypothetical protein